MHAWCSVSCFSILAALAGGCVSAVPQPTLDDAQWAASRWTGVSVADLTHGRDLYVRKCSGCHNLYAPGAVAAARWPSVVDEMVQKAGLGNSERDLIVHYLLTASRAAGATRPSQDPSARSSR